MAFSVRPSFPAFEPHGARLVPIRSRTAFQIDSSSTCESWFHRFPLRLHLYIPSPWRSSWKTVGARRMAAPMRCAKRNESASLACTPHGLRAVLAVRRHPLATHPIALISIPAVVIRKLHICLHNKLWCPTKFQDCWEGHLMPRPTDRLSTDTDDGLSTCSSTNSEAPNALAN